MSEEQQLIMAKKQKYQNRGLMEDIKKLYLNSKTADVHFEFGSGDRASPQKSIGHRK